MALDTIFYTNSSGTTTNLRSTTIRSNPKAVKGFAYTINNEAFVEGKKEFDLTIVCVGNTVANTLVNNLMVDVRDNKDGRLSINGWNLTCRCCGVTSVTTDEWGVVQFTARFYAKTFKWYKETSITISASPISLTVANEWTAFLDMTPTGTSATIDLNGNIVHLQNTLALDNIIIDDLKKKIYDDNGTEDLCGLPASDNPFKMNSAGACYISYTGVTIDTLKIHEWRGMPEWLTS